MYSRTLGSTFQTQCEALTPIFTWQTDLEIALAWKNQKSDAKRRTFYIVLVWPDYVS